MSTLPNTRTAPPARTLPRLFVLVGPDDDLALLPALAALGVTGFQVRAKAGTDRARLALVGHVLDAVRPHGATVVVDDRLDLALAAGADGVHLGAEDLPVREARRLARHLAPSLVVGATCRDADQVRAAAEDGADYAGLGPLSASGSKTGLPAPLGVAAVRAVLAAGCRLPLVGIGGVDARTAREARAAGAHGVAVIGALWRAPDPLRAAEELVAAVA